MLRQRAVLYDFISGIAFKTSNKKDTGVIPLGKEVKVIVAPIHSHNTTGGKREIMCGSDIGSLPISDHREIRQIAVVVQEQMEFNGAFGLTEVGPGKQAQTKVHCGGIETEQLVLEAEFLLFDRGSRCGRSLADGRRRPDKVPRDGGH